MSIHAPTTDCENTAAPYFVSVMASEFVPSGRRFAVIIGIQYQDTAYALARSAPDLRRVSAFLTNVLHVNPRDILALTDFGFELPEARYQVPTRKNIVDALQWLSSGAQAGDSLFFYYSGQGIQVHDTSGDEYDDLDEALIPSDFLQAGPIIDDDIHKLLVSPLPAQVLYFLSPASLDY